MKILEQKYPKGSLKGQQTAGRYIDATYYENLKILAEVIVKDMTFLGIISSSTLEVGTGKSTFVQQTAECWHHLINTLHKQNLPDVSMKNIVFKPKDLIQRSFEVPKYSCVILDEWEDAHYWSELGISLRQFFRKCRQLNLFIIAIIPNFFQLPSNYAMARSVFFIDVKFEGKFDRGYFRFFSFERKKQLYLMGKKTQNYDCVKPNFIGRFTDGYVVDEAEYRAAKYKDMVDGEEEKRVRTPEQIEREVLIKYFRQLRERLPQLTLATLCEAFGIDRTTVWRWDQKEKLIGTPNNSVVVEPLPIINNLNHTSNASMIEAPSLKVPSIAKKFEQPAGEDESLLSEV